MNANEFLQESIEYLKEEYKTFLDYQKVVEEIFDVVDVVCKKHDIPYSVFFGSLIGVCRDGGMVPWDPDMDICISIDNAERLLHALQTSLPDDYFFVSNFTNPDFEYYEMKIGKKGYDVYRIHVDVFYLLGVPKNVNLNTYMEKVQKICKMRFACVESRKSIEEFQKFGDSSKRAIYLKIIYRLRSHFLNAEQIDKKFKKLCQSGDYNKAEYVCAVDVEPYISKYCDIEPMKREIKNGKVIGMPRNPSNVLNAQYKNYKEYPSIETRFEEFRNYMKLYKKTIGTYHEEQYYVE